MEIFLYLIIRNIAMKNIAFKSILTAHTKTVTFERLPYTVVEWS